MNTNGPLHILDVVIEAKTQRDTERLRNAQAQLREDDPLLGVSNDAQTGQFMLSGTNEDQLEGAVARLTVALNGGIQAGALQVKYRETPTAASEIDYTYKKALGGAGQFARVKIALEPLAPGSGFIFENRASASSVPKEFIPALENGIAAQAENGLIAGFPVIDFKARLLDGDYHPVDSTTSAFEIAARAAFRDLAAKNVAELLEPIMTIDVETPEDFLGGVVGDLLSRKGAIRGTGSRNDAHVLTAHAPLARLLGYARTLREMTKGRGRCTMRFDHFAPVSGIPGGDDPRFPGAAALRVA